MWNKSFVKNQKLQQFFAAGMLLGVPLLLNACNPLNGDKIRLYGGEDSPAPAAPAAPAAQRQTTPPTTTPTTPVTPPCTPTASSVLENGNADIVAINAEVAAVEATSPQKADLRHQIIEYAAQFDLNHPETREQLRALVEGILVRSPNSAAAAPAAPAGPAAPASAPAQPPTASPASLPAQPRPAAPAAPLPPVVAVVPAAPAAPAAAPVAAPGPGLTHSSIPALTIGPPTSPGAMGNSPILAQGSQTESTPSTVSTAPAAPYFLHNAIVAFVVHRRAANFAKNPDGQIRTSNAAEIKAFADFFLTFPTDLDVVYATYVKAFNFAMNPAQLGLGTVTLAQQAVKAILQRPNGVQLALGYMDIFARDLEYHYSKGEAIADANHAAFIDPTAPIPATPPAAATPASRPAAPATPPVASPAGVPAARPAPASPGASH